MQGHDQRVVKVQGTSISGWRARYDHEPIQQTGNEFAYKDVGGGQIINIKVVHGQRVGEVGAPEDQSSPVQQSLAMRVIRFLPIEASYKIKLWHPCWC